MPAHDEQGGLRTYGRRKGKKLSARKQALVEDLLPRLRVHPDEPCPSEPAAIFGRPVESIALEIGFGAGEHLCEQAKAHPDWGFIGSEVYLNGVAALLSRLEREKLTNIRLYDGDARELLSWLPDASLERIYVLFPDPWPKKRHHKRRLVAPETVQEFARLLRPGGELRIASDIPGYIRSSLIALRQIAELEWVAGRPEHWRSRPGDWPQTRYEGKALQEGRSCTYLSFRRAA